MSKRLESADEILNENDLLREILWQLKTKLACQLEGCSLIKDRLGKLNSSRAWATDTSSLEIEHERVGTENVELRSEIEELKGELVLLKSLGNS